MNAKFSDLSIDYQRLNYFYNGTFGEKKRKLFCFVKMYFK